MSPSERTIELPSETTEQALARVEAECGWSDVGRFVPAPPKSPAAAPADREPREG